MTVMVVERDKLIKNIGIVLKNTEDTEVIAVLKGNGYGLSTLPFARILFEQGIKFFAVTGLDDALLLRKHFETVTILLLTPNFEKDELLLALQNNIILTVDSYEGAVLLSGVAEENSLEARVHVKFDTGFGRFGFLPNETDKVLNIHGSLTAIKIEGIYSHLHSAFSKAKFTIRQNEAFSKILVDLSQGGLDIPFAHLANSCGALLHKNTHYKGVRIGSAFLGRLPVKNRWKLEKVGCLQNTVLEVKWLPKGHTIGYGGVYTAKNPVKIAIVGTGYETGFGMEKSKDTFRFRDVLRYGWNEFKGLFYDRRPFGIIGGKKVRVLGRVSMCNVCLDVTNLEVSPGDTVHFEVNPLFVPQSVERIYV